MAQTTHHQRGINSLLEWALIVAAALLALAPADASAAPRFKALGRNVVVTILPESSAFYLNKLYVYDADTNEPITGAAIATNEEFGKVVDLGNLGASLLAQRTVYFGIEVTNTGDFFYTDASLNPNKKTQAKVTPEGADRQFGNKYKVSFEDRKSSESDDGLAEGVPKDFNDFVFQVTGLTWI